MIVLRGLFSTFLEKWIDSEGWPNIISEEKQPVASRIPSPTYTDGHTGTGCMAQASLFSITAEPEEYHL
jgi:hypothetical protein